MTSLRLLRDAGVEIGLDDFGTGYSSLAYLRQFPLDFVKIDRSFIHGLTVTAGQGAIVAAIIDLAHAIGLYVVAEGVETEAQLEALKRLGCDRAQGFLLARPAAAEVVGDLITTGPPPS
jgi:EAL domain-containing protein (putative c-di-GMP-specific phosphodiesterase class I)